MAGDGRFESRGDGGPAVRASLDLPKAVAPTADGGFLVSEVGRIRRVPPDGTITTVVGRQIFAPQAPGVPVGDGGPGPPRRLNAAVTAVDGGTHALVVRIRSTDAGRATVTRALAPRPHRGVGERVCSLRAGRDPAARVVPGRYWIHLTVTSPGDRRTSVRMAVLLGQAFPVSAARHAADCRPGRQRPIAHVPPVQLPRVDFRGAAKRRCVRIDAVTRRGPSAFVRPYG